MIEVTTTARAALRARQASIADMEAAAAGLEHRIAGFTDTATAVQPSARRAAELRARRSELLAAVALSEAPAADLDRLDAELADAEARALAGARAAEIAAAGATRLQVEHAAVAQRLTNAHQQLPALKHAAALELAAEKLAPYRAALVALGKAHADLAGACLAADHYMDLHNDPKRLPVTGPMNVARFDAPLPLLRGLDPEEWVFGIAMSIMAAKADALAELQGRTE